MKSSFIILVFSLLLLPSCSYFVPHYYGFYFQNDSDIDVFFIMDYSPYDNLITEDGYQKIAEKGKIVTCTLKDRDCFEKYIEDSVYIYVGYLDSLRNADGRINVDLSKVKDSYFISRMTLYEELIIDPTHKSPMKTIYYPPREESIPIIYYR